MRSINLSTRTILFISRMMTPILFLLMIGSHEALGSTDKTSSFNSHWANTAYINTNWLYLERDTENLPTDGDEAFQTINLPHTWNAIDGITQDEYRRAGSWYRKYLNLDTLRSNQRVYLRFGAAGQEAVVYCNGDSILHHIGGYSAFTCELTNHLNEGDNRIDVWVSNLLKESIAPITADFNFYGGLYRSVELIIAPKISISRDHFGGPGVRVWSESISSANADLNVSAILDNGSSASQQITVMATLHNSSGTIVSEGSITETISGKTTKEVNISMPDVSNPALWSPESPTLYTVQVSLHIGDKFVDYAFANHGFRWFEFTATNGFYLNGNSYKLRGVNRHQDFEGLGNALSPEHHLNDIRLIKETGANWLRLAHYQQDDYVLDLCDRLGLLVWEEIPYVNNTTEDLDFEPNLHAMMKDMIEQHFNHPSIIVWGIGNELWLGDRGDGKATCYDILQGLHNLIHSEDPVRKSVYVNRDNDLMSDLQVSDIPDIIAYNLYRGWYNSTYTDLTNRLNHHHDNDPGKPLILSEFGAGSDLEIHTETPERFDFSTEYQNDFIESHLDQLASSSLNWLNGANWWCFNDFGSSTRGDSKPHINQKGVITGTRFKKDSYFIMQSKWSSEPMVYLASPSWNERSGDRTYDFTVYTNMDAVELFQNGTSLGTQTSNFVWSVTLVDGANLITAQATSGSVQKQHGFVVSFNSSSNGSYTVTASSEEDSYPAENAVDGDESTRWAAEGTDQWIKLDLLQTVSVTGVQIKFYNGNSRNYYLDIQGSTDDSSWETYYTGQSSTSPDMFDTFLFDESKDIRYLQILANGNNDNNWNSYFEVIPLYDGADRITRHDLPLNMSYNERSNLIIWHQTNQDQDVHVELRDIFTDELYGHTVRTVHGNDSVHLSFVPEEVPNVNSTSLHWVVYMSPVGLGWDDQFGKIFYQNVIIDSLMVNPVIKHPILSTDNLTNLPDSDTGLQVNNQNTLEVMVYPNPVEDELNIEVENIELYSIGIHSIDGVLLKSYRNIHANNYQIDLTELLSGFYIMELEGSCNKKITIQVIKQ